MASLVLPQALACPNVHLQLSGKPRAPSENSNAAQPLRLGYVHTRTNTQLSRRAFAPSSGSNCCWRLQKNGSLQKSRSSTKLVVFCSADEGGDKAAGGGGGGSLLSFLCPLLKLFSGGDAAAPRNRSLEVATTGLASIARLPWGSKVREDIVIAGGGEERKPQKLLQLYEFEACPFCRRVREALTELDLAAEVYPCPKDSLRHRAAVQEAGGRQQFPFLIDPNTGVSLYESGDIVKYLFREYGNGASPTAGLLESTPLTGWVPTLVRAGRGMSRYSKARAQAPAAAIELYSYENNQFARLVREALCELELPYVLQNVGKGSPGRVALLQLAGSTQVPYLVDNNTGVALAESDAIIRYLFDTYSDKDTKSEFVGQPS